MSIIGFLNNEDNNTIVLNKGDLILRYQDSNATENALLSVISGNMKLEGANSSIYELDSRLPVFLSSVFKRPINIEFTTVSKEYDGTTVNESSLRGFFNKTSDKDSGLVIGNDNNYYTYQAYVSVESGGRGYEAGDQFVISIDGSTVCSSSSTNYLAGTVDSVSSSGSVESVSFDSDEDLYVGCEFICNSPTCYICHDFRNTDSPEYPRFDIRFIKGNGSGLVLKLTRVCKNINSFKCNPEGAIWTESDVGKIELREASSEYSDANLINKIQDIRHANLEIVPGTRGDASMNYVIRNVVSKGIIRPRSATFEVVTPKSLQYGFEKEVQISTVLTNRVNDDDVYTEPITATLLVQFNPSENRYTYKLNLDDIYSASRSLISLKGKDSYKYSSGQCSVDLSQCYIEIEQAPINIRFNTFRYNPLSSSWDISYSLDGQIGSDNLCIDIENIEVETGYNKICLRDLDKTVLTDSQIKLSGFHLIGERSSLYRVTNEYIYIDVQGGANNDSNS